MQASQPRGSTAVLANANFSTTAFFASQTLHVQLAKTQTSHSTTTRQNEMINPGPQQHVPSNALPQRASSKGLGRVDDRDIIAALMITESVDGSGEAQPERFSLLQLPTDMLLDIGRSQSLCTPEGGVALAMLACTCSFFGKASEHKKLHFAEQRAFEFCRQIGALRLPPLVPAASLLASSA